MRRADRLLLGVLLAVAACVTAGCGSHDADGRAARGAALPQALARRLAAESDDVARKLAAGAPCAALSVARELRQQAVGAIDAGRVPTAYRSTLRSTTTDLASRIRCVIPTPRAQPAAPPPGPGNEGHGKHKGHGKGNGQGKGNGDENGGGD